MMDGNFFNSNLLTAVATILLVFVGIAQIVVLVAQKKQTRIGLTEQYRLLWSSYKKYWGIVVFIGRENDEYYQVLDEISINSLKDKTQKHSYYTPTIWALESIQKVCGILGEVSTRVLQRNLIISDVYPIFGTEFLRHTRPLRQLLEPEYQKSLFNEDKTSQHRHIRIEMQDWLVYHDGLRRRCLILIDLLWAEAARLEDLPPSDLKSAADTKIITGDLNRKRVWQEILKLNGIKKFFYAIKLSRFLKRSEYCSFSNWNGIRKKRLNVLDKKWTERLLRTNRTGS